MKEYKQIFRVVALISQVGITMLSSVFVCGLIGYFIDDRFQTHTFIVFLVLGIAGGYRAVYSLIKQFIVKKEDQANEETGSDR
ncbi:MAG: AtpZ/AtpI family protein [Bacteroides sp.]|nr:AtpZ/AtpI family protein [Bacteroides sp.]MCM1550411.1 AtpZ/AtpI family protein [Clostridium sp.]